MKNRIGQYSHVPGQEFRPGTDGKPVPVRVRRRFPHLGIVCMAYAGLGPLAASGAELLFKLPGWREWAPKAIDQAVTLPPSPSLNNVMFGAGAIEVALASLLAGWMLWRSLWNVRLPQSVQEAGPRSTFPRLVWRGFWSGIGFTLLACPIVAFGFAMRDPALDIPLITRPIAGILAVLPLLISRAFTVIPVLLVLSGAALGVLSAAAVAHLWQDFPEEPVFD